MNSKGGARVELCGSCPEALLNACAREGLSLAGVERRDACTLTASIPRRELRRLTELAEDRGCRVSVLRPPRLDRALGLLHRRRLLLAALTLVLLLALGSTLFIWEFRVEGCEKLSQGEVLRALADCGVTEGCFWPGLDREALRSRMLLRLPELAWMTVNVSGSRATVLVLERSVKPELVDLGAISDLVAARPGVVRALSIRSGRALVVPGETVEAGQVLVSGRLESLRGTVRQTRAMGSVTADTWYELTAVCPLDARKKGEETGRFSRFALKLGKKRINFYCSGQKELDGYDTIVHEYRVGWEGVFALPVSLLREDWIGHALSPLEALPENEMRSDLLYGLRQRIDGEILSCDFSAERTDALFCVTLRARCRENIALTKETGEAAAPP